MPDFDPTCGKSTGIRPSSSVRLRELERLASKASKPAVVTVSVSSPRHSKMGFVIALAGVVGVLHYLIGGIDQPTLLTAYAAMLGIPAFLSVPVDTADETG